MPAFARPILLPIPTVTAINGHAFGAGMMHALGHDYRLQKKERGFQCAVEVAIGIKTPSPELTLFRHSMSASAFYETVVLGKRWSGDEAAAAGIVNRSVPGDQLLQVALNEAAGHARLGANHSVCMMNSYGDEYLFMRFDISGYEILQDGDQGIRG
jgi:enoyl-CoA hydratase/carnithine racemase